MIIQGTTIQNATVKDVYNIVTANLVANYDPHTGISGSTFNDSSGNGYNATLYNSPTTTSVNGFNVLQLNGTNQYYYYTPGYTSLTGAVTFDAWFNTSQVSNQAIVSEYGQAGLAGGWEDAVLGLNSTKMAGGVYNGSTGGYKASTNNYSSSTWYNLTFTAAAGAYNLYVNGIVQGSPLNTTRQTTPSPLYYAVGYPDGTAGIYLGGGGSNYFKGMIGPVKFYSTTLTQSQITQNFNALRGRFGV